MCMHAHDARMRRLVWSGDGTYVRRPSGARQNMRVRWLTYTGRSCRVLDDFFYRKQKRQDWDYKIYHVEGDMHIIGASVSEPLH